MTERSLPPEQTAPSPTLDTRAGEMLQAWVGQIVVLDTQGALFYVGTLSEVTDRYYILTDADVHHASDSRTAKDLYLVETRDLGVKVNRGRVVVERREIASVSLLREVSC